LELSKNNFLVILSNKNSKESQPLDVRVKETIVSKDSIEIIEEIEITLRNLYFV